MPDKFDRERFESIGESQKRLQEKMQRAVDKMMEEQNRMEDEATINALRRYGYDVIKWHPYPEEKPTKEGWYLLTLNSHYEPVGSDDWSMKHGWNYYAPVEVLAWAEQPKPYEG